MRQFKRFETERIILSATSTEDAHFILQLTNTPKWIKYIGDRKVYTLEHATNYIKNKIQPQQDRLGYSNYTLILKSSGTKIGTCGLYDRDGMEGIDIGFAMLPEFEGKGYAYEAAVALLDFAFNDLGMTSVSAITTRDNASSQKLLEKLGLKYLNTISFPNDDEELLLFKINAPRE